jgi:hypothetical protein
VLTGGGATEWRGQRLDRGQAEGAGCQRRMGRRRRRRNEFDSEMAMMGHMVGDLGGRRVG